MVVAARHLVIGEGRGRVGTRGLRGLCACGESERDQCGGYGASFGWSVVIGHLGGPDFLSLGKKQLGGGHIYLALRTSRFTCGSGSAHGSGRRQGANLLGSPRRSGPRLSHILRRKWVGAAGGHDLDSHTNAGEATADEHRLPPCRHRQGAPCP